MHPQFMFRAEMRTLTYTLVNPRFTKCRVHAGWGSTLHGLLNVMMQSLFTFLSHRIRDRVSLFVSRS